jgi:beta-galactosidase/beta-glucuronidase
MRRGLILAVLLILLGGPAHGVLTMVAALPAVATSISLSGEWRFAVDRERIGLAQNWQEPTFDDSSWLAVSVPHTWNVMPDYKDYEGIAWYRRTFSLPAEADEGHVRLHFGAVYYLARVWLNGQLLGEHEGGYTPFEFDVTGTAKSDVVNVIAVQVDNLRTMNRIPAVLRKDWSFDWWNYGGIVRDVSLEVTSRAYIARQRIVATPHLTGLDEADSAAVTAIVSVSNTTNQPLEATLNVDVLDDATGRSVVASPASASVSIPPGESTDVPLNLTIDSPRLWHFDHPNLYRWTASLRTRTGQTLHSAQLTFGVRSVELKDARFYLNGEPVRLVGVTRHADSPEYGLAEPVTVMAADYDDLKTLNEVLSRPVHYPQHEFMLDYADRHGILLIPEVPAWQLTAAQMADPHMRQLEQQQLHEMIDASFNHPSVWAWSIGNEIESQSGAGRDFVKTMLAYVKSLDPTRPVGFASNNLGGSPQTDATALSDFVLMNQYFGTWVGPKGWLGGALDLIHKTWPQKTVIISEYGFEPHWNRFWGPPTSSLKASDYYFVPDNVAPDSEEADAQRRQLIVDQLGVFRNKPYVAGAIFWTYQDYRTRTNFIMGLVDPERRRRGSWALLREEYAPIRFESATFAAASGNTWQVEVTLRTRGPVETDMPAYTLRGYRLHWLVLSLDGSTIYSEGDVPLPVLAPGTTWRSSMAWTAPDKPYAVTLRIVRPTGFAVLERSYSPQGDIF